MNWIYQFSSWSSIMNENQLNSSQMKLIWIILIINNDIKFSWILRKWSSSGSSWSSIIRSKSIAFTENEAHLDHLKWTKFSCFQWKWSSSGSSWSSQMNQIQLNSLKWMFYSMFIIINNERKSVAFIKMNALLNVHYHQ
jgi:hypothetical protein